MFYSLNQAAMLLSEKRADIVILLKTENNLGNSLSFLRLSCKLIQLIIHGSNFSAL